MNSNSRPLALGSVTSGSLRENHQRPNGYSAHGSAGHDTPSAVYPPGHRRGHGLAQELEVRGNFGCSPASSYRTESEPSRTPAPHGAGVLRGTDPVNPLGDSWLTGPAPQSPAS